MPEFVTVPPALSVAPAPTRITPALAPVPVPALAVKVLPVSDKVALAASCRLSTFSFRPDVTVKAGPTASRIASSEAPGTMPPPQSDALVKLPLMAFSQ